MHCQKIDPSSKKELVEFLKAHEEYTLFLLSNLEMYGPALSTALYSGNYKIIRNQEKIVAAFCLARNGALLIHSTFPSTLVFPLVLAACQEEPLAITGLLGEWEFSHAFWKLLKDKKIIRKEAFTSKEILYTLLPAEIFSPSPSSVRLLTPEDFEEWKHLRLNYIEEMGFPSYGLKEIHEEFIEKTHKRITWGLFSQGELASIADLNACTADLGQVGGVYTKPAFRKQGLCTQLMRQLIHDCHHLHHLRKLIIFTGEENLPARSVYESLDARAHGYYALYFGSG